MPKIKSPITGSENTKVLKVYPKIHFIDMYKKSIDFNVSRFFEHVEDVFYVKCLDTGHKFFYPDSICGDGAFYEDLQKFEWYYHQEKWEFDEAMSQIDINERVLEIGAGDGAFLNKLKSKTSNIEAIEFNKTSIDLLETQGYQIHNQSIQELSKTKANYYDVVVSFQVLEHISDVKSFIEASITLLKEGGKLIISTPNNKATIMHFDHNLSLNFPPHHIGHWDSSTYTQLQKYFHIKLSNIVNEPLEEPMYCRYYRVLALHLRKKYGFFGKALDKLLYPYSYYLVKKFAKNLKGLSMVVTYTKNENEKN